jgi:hypothetical protein
MTDKKKTTKKKATRKKTTKKVVKKDSNVSATNKDTNKEEEKPTSTATAETPPQQQSIESQEYEQVDTITLERIKAKFINLTGYPIRVMCGKKWAEIPCDPSKIARVLYSVALKETTEDINIYFHGINTVTGVPETVDGLYYIVLPEVRFILQERNDLLTHGELIYDGQTKRPIGFKNLFCSPGDSSSFTKI